MGHRNDAPCAEVLDWLMQTVTFVDGDAHSMSTDWPFCNVNACLSAFQVRLASREAQRAQSNRASSCRMGRLRRLDA